MTSKFRAYVDFDGTLVVPNVAILLVEEFCPDGKNVAHEVDQLLHSGQMTLREAWERQAALLPLDRLPEMAEWAVAKVPLRAGAKEFLATAERFRVPVTVVSGGLDFYIRAVLEREGLDLPLLSDTFAPGESGRLRVAHPFSHPTCRLCGICKAEIVRSHLPASTPTIFLGDGSTDRYAAEVADIVFARHRLKSYCERSGVPFFPFEDFAPVTARIARWLEGTENPPQHRQHGLASSLCPISRELAGLPPDSMTSRLSMTPGPRPDRPAPPPSSGRSVPQTDRWRPEV